MLNATFVMTISQKMVINGYFHSEMAKLKINLFGDFGEKSNLLLNFVTIWTLVQNLDFLCLTLIISTCLLEPWRLTTQIRFSEPILWEMDFFASIPNFFLVLFRKPSLIWVERIFITLSNNLSEGYPGYLFPGRKSRGFFQYYFDKKLESCPFWV